MVVVASGAVVVVAGGRVVVVVLVVVVSARPAGRSSGRMAVYVLVVGQPAGRQHQRAGGDHDGRPPPRAAVQRPTRVRTSPSLQFRRERDDEAGAAAGPVLDPRRAAVDGGVLGDEGEAEPGADPVPGGGAAGEALEDAGALGLASPRGRRPPRRGSRCRRPPSSMAMPRRAAAVLLGVVEEVGEDPLEPALVDRHRSLGPPVVDPHRHVVEAVARRDAPHDVAEEHGLGVELGRRRRRAGRSPGGRAPSGRTGAPGWSTTSRACWRRARAGRRAGRRAPRPRPSAR